MPDQNVPDMAKDKRVIKARKRLLKAAQLYQGFSTVYSLTQEWDAPFPSSMENEMLLMEHDLRQALADIEEASKLFYKEHPDGINH